MDPETQSFARTFTAFADAMGDLARADQEERGELTEVGRLVQAFLGVDLAEVEPVTELFPNLQVVDLDLALEALVTEYGGERFGIRGPSRGHIDTFPEFLNRTHWAFARGPVSYERMPTGPDSDRRVVSFAVGQLHVAGVPLVWLQRARNPQYGRDRYTLELLCRDPGTVESFMHRVREQMAARSVLRGQVISFASNDFDYHNPGDGLTFLSRPELAADQVVLPEGVLDRITRHVVGLGEHRAALRSAGQHLRRGVLLYGPPGTGKTHVVRHLLSRTPGTTAVLLSGRTLGLLRDATALARAAQPALIVLEDCDLIAEERGGGTNAALFETLEAMDGLAADADITFVLTTNRADLLERALVERPGRVDLAVEIGKPDLEGRERLFELYGASLLASGQISRAALHTAATRTEGVTASFAKEAIRRTVINAAQEGRPPADRDISQALEEMLSDAEALTRTLLGGEGGSFGDVPGPDHEDEGDGRRLGPRPGLAPPVGPGASWTMGFEG